MDREARERGRLADAVQKAIFRYRDARHRVMAAPTIESAQELEDSRVALMVAEHDLARFLRVRDGF